MCGHECFVTFFSVMYRANRTDTSDYASSGLPDALNTSALLCSACTLRLFFTEVVSPSCPGNLWLTLWVQYSCVVCLALFFCEKFVVGKAVSQKQATTTIINPANSTRPIPKVTSRSGILAGFIFLVGCMCSMECRLSSAAIDYEEISLGMKLLLRSSYFT